MWICCRPPVISKGVWLCVLSFVRLFLYSRLCQTSSALVRSVCLCLSLLLWYIILLPTTGVHTMAFTVICVNVRMYRKDLSGFSDSCQNVAFRFTFISEQVIYLVYFPGMFLGGAVSLVSPNFKFNYSVCG